jgi:porphobilinogen synthase
MDSELGFEPRTTDRDLATESPATWQVPMQAPDGGLSAFPRNRPRRLRCSPSFRRMMRETWLNPADLIYPLFVVHGQGIKEEIRSMPGNYHWSIDQLPAEVEEIARLGIPSVILFGLPAEKDPIGRENFHPEGIVQQAIRAIKDAVPEMFVITDVCMCEYTDHGHCGVIHDRPAYCKGKGLPGGCLDNDATLEILSRVALSHAEAGVDMVAPSDMMDGRVGAIRTALDAAHYDCVGIMSYAAKYASAFYGPFREAADSPPQFGDRCGYQMDPPNAREAMREVALDIAEGADIVMVKPALAYLDVIRQVRDRFDLPVAAYNVSGEFSMVKAAAERGWIDEQRVALEWLTGIKRAGADMIITYWAKDVARWVGESGVR